MTNGWRAGTSEIHPAKAAARGGCASLAGVVPRIIKNQPDGTLPLDIIKSYIRGTDVHHAQSRIVALENTHNFCGGRVLSTEYVNSVGNFIQEYNASHTNNVVKLHMDGARIFNAAVALGKDVSELTKSVDSISVCLSKGLAAPVGSVLIGNNEFIGKARRWRKALGGGMRQAGVIAAAGIVALNSMVKKLPEDHKHAKLIADSIKDIPAITVFPVETNIVIAEFKEGHHDADKNAIKLRDLLKQKGLLISSINSQTFRVTTHYQITEKNAEKAARLIHEAFDELK